MAEKSAAQELLILGVYLKSDAYPNNLFRVRDLKNTPGLCVSEINHPMWSSTTQRYHGNKRLFRNPFRALSAHTAVIFRYLFLTHKGTVYIPYPAILISFFLTLLPKHLKPKRCIIDAFISLYDTLVFDRCLLRQESLSARFLWRIEKRVFSNADTVIVDTPQNAVYLAKLFDLPRDQFHAIPLSTDEKHFFYKPYSAQKGICRVLFIGTLIPLHGIETIVEAMNELRDDKNILFNIIGDGQSAGVLEVYQRTNPGNLVWIRQWQHPCSLAEAIKKSDICLGIFGSGKKTQRVCPLKIYAYSSIGRAIITAETEWSLTALTSGDESPFSLVPANNGNKLAENIWKLCTSPAIRSRLALASQKYYHENLSNKCSHKSLLDIVFKY